MKQARGIRTLNRQQGSALPQGIDDGARWCLALQERNHLVVVRSVGQDPGSILFPAPDDDIVLHPTALVEDHRILRPTRRNIGNVVAKQTPEQRRGPLPFDRNPAQVAHVEHTDALTHRVVLCDHTLVLERHLPTAEVGEARPERCVLVVERGARRHREKGTPGIRGRIDVLGGAGVSRRLPRPRRVG